MIAKLIRRFFLGKGPLTRATLMVMLSSAVALAQGPNSATISVQAGAPGPSISSNLFGIFFEEINFGGEGGLYAEMVRNRSFDNSSSPDFWTLVTQGTAAGQMNVDSSVPLNTNRPNALALTFLSGAGSVGAANSGFWGLALQAGSNYNLTFYAQAAGGFGAPISARLESADGSTLYAQTALSGVTASWQRFAATLTPSTTDTNARLVLSISQPGTVWLTVVSLFPAGTFHSHANGLRLDLANLLGGLRPSFMRYPGGNFIESNNVTNAVRWKKTIGDIAQRPGHLNDAWGYWSTDGFGLHEFLLYCEDLGMEPLYGINCGLMLGYNGNTNNTVPLNQMGPWVQDALDLIQYANGDTNSTWGAVRAANGHPAPFNLKYLEIGNENGGSYYNDRYALFYDAIRTNYPQIHLIAPVWGGIPTSRPVEIQDEHYYSDPGTFRSYATKYDTYSRGGPKVFVGEYAVTSGYGVYGNLNAALGEAAFMTGMERNADLVLMASYAPLFANVNGMQWHPDLLNFDNGRAFGTPSYYVQQLFSRNRGDVVLPVAVTLPTGFTNLPPHGAIGVGSWNTAVQYTNIVVTSNGVVLYQSDFVNNGTSGWRVFNGAWSTSAGVYQQTSATTTDCRSTTGNTNWANYTLSLRARKLSGSEGFLILCNWQDDNNWAWFNIGGWGNTLDGVEQMINGSKSILGTRNSDNIASNQWYDISVVLSNTTALCYLNGTLVQNVTLQTNAGGGLFASSLYDQHNQQVIVKAVNSYAQPVPTTFNLGGVAGLSSNATLTQLTSGSLADENSLAVPANVLPTTNQLSNAATNLALTLPANSLSVLRLQLTTPLPPGGFKAVASGWQVALSWPPYYGATNYVVQRATSSGGPYTTLVTTGGLAFNDTSVAIGRIYYYVLSATLPAGPTPNSAEASASIGATLRAYLPFDASGGTTAVDATGHGWNGTLVNGPTWVPGYSGNAVNLNGTTQYVSLPTGLTTNLGDFSITAWVNLAVAGTWSRVFDFGSGTTTNMFLTPKSGSSTLRFAMTTGGGNAEQRVEGPTPLPTNGWHHVAVTASGGVGTLYVDGTGVGTNSALGLTPGKLGVLGQNWLGRSQYSADPYLNGKVDDFRIYAGALSAGDIATFLSPLSPPANVGALAGQGQVAVSWSATPNANGYNLKRSTTNGGPYALLATNLVGLTFTDTAVLNGTLYYYVVAATNSVGASADSNPAAAARPVALNPPTISVATASSQLQLSWAQDHTGWRLQSQNNPPGVGLSTNWQTVPNSTNFSQVTIPLVVTNGSVFFRLVYP
jgi:alpha-L-arabinofuranosidase